MAVIGGIFGWRTDYHLAEMVVSFDANGLAFIRAFKDVFIIGASGGLLGAFVFLIGGWDLAKGRIDDEILG